MIIVGGTYEEIVVVPESHDVAGSGLRAAASLANRDEVPRFHTVLNKGHLARKQNSFAKLSALISQARLNAPRGSAFGTSPR